MDFAQQSPVLALSGMAVERLWSLGRYHAGIVTLIPVTFHADRDSMDNVNSEPENLSSTPNTAPRGKYQIVASKTKSSQVDKNRILMEKYSLEYALLACLP